MTTLPYTIYRYYPTGDLDCPTSARLQCCPANADITDEANWSMPLFGRITADEEAALQKAPSETAHLKDQIKWWKNVVKTLLEEQG